MSERVLFVDDDPQILSAFKRNLRKRFELHTAEGGAQGLAMLKDDGPFAVVISDQQMPKMDGVSFLKEVKARSPLTVRMMLTGNADQRTAMEAVNEGHIFRFLNKPCTPENLGKAIIAAQRQYRLMTAEKDLLEQTLAGSVKVLVDVLSLHSPETFKQTGRLRGWARKLAEALELPDTWTLDMTVMLAAIGQITLPQNIVTKLSKKQPLSDVEQELAVRTPLVAKGLIANIPRMDPVANAVYYQNKGFDGSGFPEDDVSGKDIPLEARVLRILTDLAALSNVDQPPSTCFDELAGEAHLYDEKILAAARGCLVGAELSDEEVVAGAVVKMTVDQLAVGFKTARDITAETGTMILSAGHSLSPAMIEKIQQYHKIQAIDEPIHLVRE